MTPEKQPLQKKAVFSIIILSKIQPVVHTEFILGHYLYISQLALHTTKAVGFLGNP